MHTNSISFTPETRRISALDALRGFALLGIVLVNSLGFNASFFNFGGFYASLPDPFQQEFYKIFISLSADKFIFLFSFLFGYGIYMQYRKWQFNNALFPAFFSRRMLFLALAGIFHIILLWAGDILLLYAIAGMLVLLMRKLPNGLVLGIGFFFYFFIAFWLTAAVHLPLPDALSSTSPESLDQAKIIYANGNFFEVLQLRLIEYLAFHNINLFYYLPKIVGLSLIGFAASSENLHQSIATRRYLWTIIWVFISALGIFLYFNYTKIVDSESDYANAIYMAGYEMMNLFVAGSYFLLIMLLAQGKIGSVILKPFSRLGRMSLTAYLMQSFILAFIFQGWGLGLFGMTEVSNVVLIAVCIFVLQLILAEFWLKHHHQGPLEMLWRKFSYPVL